jgi:hypothetical protein
MSQIEVISTMQKALDIVKENFDRSVEDIKKNIIIKVE